MNTLLDQEFKDPTEALNPETIKLRLAGVRADESGGELLDGEGKIIAKLSHHDTVTLRDGNITVDMYTVDGTKTVDYAEITIKTPLSDRTATQRGIALRFGGTKPADLMQRTPVQYFTSERAFADLPISGRARWLAVDPDGNFLEGLFDDRDPDSDVMPRKFGKGWTFVWVVEGSRPFKFGELCSPRFIDQFDDIPLGEDGIRELEAPDDAATLPEAFTQRLNYYMSGEHLRIRP